VIEKTINNLKIYIQKQKNLQNPICGLWVFLRFFSKKQKNLGFLKATSPALVVCLCILSYTESACVLRCKVFFSNQ